MVRPLITAGVDIGSLSTEAVVLDNGRMVCYSICDTGSFPRRAGERALEEALSRAGYSHEALSYTVATGYGRNLVSFANKTVTEISCHARGARIVDPSIELVIDIGGQDSKVILLDPEGTILEFTLNDRCAAGTGRFLEKMATILGTDVEGLSRMGLSSDPVTISSTCAVFAESEAISLLASEIPAGRIAAGIHQSVADRISSMVRRVGVRSRALFCGGVAKSGAMKQALEKSTAMSIIVPDQPQIIGALGAAFHSYDFAVKNS